MQHDLSNPLEGRNVFSPHPVCTCPATLFTLPIYFHYRANDIPVKFAAENNDSCFCGTDKESCFYLPRSEGSFFKDSTNTQTQLSSFSFAMPHS